MSGPGNDLFEDDEILLDFNFEGNGLQPRYTGDVDDMGGETMISTAFGKPSTLQVLSRPTTVTSTTNAITY